MKDIQKYELVLISPNGAKEGIYIDLPADCKLLKIYDIIKEHFEKFNATGVAKEN